MKRATFKFTSRDSDLLVDLYKHRFLTVSQIRRLHFPSMQTAYRRLRQLKTNGFITSFTVANIEESILTLATAGLQAVAEALGVDRSSLKWTEAKTKPRDYYFMRYFVAINDFRITLRQACEASGVRLLGFIPDYYGEKTEAGGITKYIRDVICDIADPREQVSHTPDGVFALERNGKQALFFLEIDRGTEVVSDPSKGVLKSIRFYANYLLGGHYQRYAKDFGVSEFRGFRSLYVTTTAVRLQNIREAASDLQAPQKAKRFHWITTRSRRKRYSRRYGSRLTPRTLPRTRSANPYHQPKGTNMAITLKEETILNEWSTIVEHGAEYVLPVLASIQERLREAVMPGVCTWAIEEV